MQWSLEKKKIGHWVIAVVSNNVQKIKLYDLVENFGVTLNGHCVFEDVTKFLKTSNYISNMAACQWQLEYPETPQQEDSSSCGVFACQIAKQIPRSQKIELKTSDISYLRKEMTCEIALCKRMILGTGSPQLFMSRTKFYDSI